MNWFKETFFKIISKEILSPAQMIFKIFFSFSRLKNHINWDTDLSKSWKYKKEEDEKFSVNCYDSCKIKVDSI